MRKKVNIFWFRRDLRVNDNHAFYKALKSDLPVLPVFIFDKKILQRLNTKNDARVNFIYNEIQKIKAEFEKEGSSVKVLFENPLFAFQQLLHEYEVKEVYANKDYEPYAKGRDLEIQDFLSSKGVVFKTFKDQVIFEKNEIVKADEKPYTVFTPYSKKWKNAFSKNEIQQFPSEKLLGKLVKLKPLNFLELKELGFEKSRIIFPPKVFENSLIENYSSVRDIPSITGTSKLGVHLRFGTISIRDLVKMAAGLSETFLNELIWREFFMQILWHFPHVENRAFKPKYDFILWRNNETDFEKWCRGETGFPLVDAGMRELNETGFMHNRVRMVAAGFLTKHLLIDWRWGEAYFAEKLLDFELASNNGNWQWAAGSGCDAAPYFRIFNPESQQKRFDPNAKYISKWVPEYETKSYIKPMIEHKFARERAIETYKKSFN